MKKLLKKSTSILLAVVMIVLMMTVSIVSVSATNSVIENALSWELNIANDDTHQYYDVI